jgi:hypothetical protein
LNISSPFDKSVGGSIVLKCFKTTKSIPGQEFRSKQAKTF